MLYLIYELNLSTKVSQGMRAHLSSFRVKSFFTWSDGLNWAWISTKEDQRNWAQGTHWPKLERSCRSRNWVGSQSEFVQNFESLQKYPAPGRRPGAALAQLGH